MPSPIPRTMRIFRTFPPQPSWRTAIMVLLAAAMLVPLIVGNGFFFPYVVPRNLYFRALVETGTAVVVLALCFGRKRIDLRGEPVFWALVAFLGAATLSALFSPARMHSFFGDFERMGGVWAFLNLVLFFLLLRTLRDEDWPWILNSALAVGLFVSLSVIVQHGELAALARSSDAIVSAATSAVRHHRRVPASRAMDVGPCASRAVSLP